jgi:hypothetical protein
VRRVDRVVQICGSESHWSGPVVFFCQK